MEETCIALGTDHAGFQYKEIIKKYLEGKGIKVKDFGAYSSERVDYPDFVRPAAQAVARGECHLGIVFGGSGNGEAMVANKVNGVRCAVVWSEETGRLAREHNDANVISIGERTISSETAINIVDSWLKASFEGGRHMKRVNKIEPTDYYAL